MAKINLLPWREERRAEKQQQFMTMLVGGLILAGLVFFMGYQYASNLLSTQAGRNSYLKQEVGVLDDRIKEIVELDSARAEMIGKMGVIESLQFSRPQIVKVFDSLVRLLPEGIHLNSFVRKDTELVLAGVAQSNPRVSVLMHKLDTSDLFNSPQLEVVQRVSNQDEAVRNFVLRVTEATEALAIKTDEFI